MSAHTLCISYLRELFQGIHRHTDSYKLALYAVDLDADVTAYTPDGEVKATGYAKGGKALPGLYIESKDRSVWLGLDPPQVSWPAATITARFGLIYNVTRGNKAVAVLDFGGDRTSTNGSFFVNLSPNGLIRLTVN